MNNKREKKAKYILEKVIDLKTGEENKDFIDRIGDTFYIPIDMMPHMGKELKITAKYNKNLKLSQIEMVQECSGIIIETLDNKYCFEDFYKCKFNEETWDIEEQEDIFDVAKDLDEYELCIELLNYVTKKSKEEEIAKFCIFTQEDLIELLKNKPLTIEELAKVKGFKEKRCAKYGKDIVEIINHYSNKKKDK